MSTSSPHPDAGVKAKEKANSQEISSQDLSRWNPFQPAIFTKPPKRDEADIRQPTDTTQRRFSTEPLQINQRGIKPVENRRSAVGNPGGKSMRPD